MPNIGEETAHLELSSSLLVWVDTTILENGLSTKSEHMHTKWPRKSASLYPTGMCVCVLLPKKIY